MKLKADAEQASLAKEREKAERAASLAAHASMARAVDMGPSSPSAPVRPEGHQSPPQAKSEPIYFLIQIVSFITSTGMCTGSFICSSPDSRLNASQAAVVDGEASVLPVGQCAAKRYPQLGLHGRFRETLAPLKTMNFTLKMTECVCSS